MELAVLAGAVLAGVVVAVVWLGAGLAVAVTGGHGLGVGFAEAARAVPRLVSHPGTPAQAWPPAVSRRVPGPFVYWACTLPVLALAVAAVVGVGSLVARRRSVGLERRRRMGLNPEARFARARDLVPLWVAGPTRNRVILGGVHGHLVATEDSRLGLSGDVPWWLRRRAAARRGDRGAIVVLGPTRCGKTTALAIPAILEWQGPVIGLSVKSDLMGDTIDARRRRGEVKVFDPADTTREETSAWSPLRAAGTLTGAKKAAKALAGATDWTRSSGDMKFWVSGAEDLLAPLLFVAARNNLGMAYVVSWVLTMDRPDDKGKGSQVATMNALLCRSGDPDVASDARAAAELLAGTWGLDFKQVSSIYVTAKAMITPWQDPTVARSSTGEPIDLAWLLGRPDSPDVAGQDDDDVPASAYGHRRRRGGHTDAPAGGGNTLYLCAPLHEAYRLAPVLGGLLGDLFDQAYELVGKSNEPVGPILVVVDEAGNWPLKDLQGLVSTCAGIGIQLILVYQSKAQIDAVYGPHADTVISNCLTKVFFAGLSDRSTLDYAEALLGSEHVLQRQDSVDVGGGHGRRSVTHSTTRAELLPMAMLRQVRPGEALLVHNTLPPAHLIGRFWFKDRSLYQMATGAPLPRPGAKLVAAARRVPRRPATGTATLRGRRLTPDPADGAADTAAEAKR